MTVATEIIKKFIKAAKGDKAPNYGKLKANLQAKVREGSATKAEEGALQILRDKDELATLSQKAASATTRAKNKPVSLAGPERFGGVGTTNKSYGGSMKKKTTMKKIGGKIGRGCGAALRGGGKVMR